MARDRLDELSRELSAGERKDLLRRIGNALAQEQTEEIVRPVELPAEERARLVREDMRKVPWFGRLLIWLESLLTGRDTQTVFVRVKIRELKTRIRHVNASLTGFESRDLSPKFARQVYEVFRHVTPLADVCRAFAKDRELREMAFTTLVEEGWEGAKRNVEDLVPMEDMERTYSQKGSVEEIRRHVTRGITEYLKSIPHELVNKLSEQVRPIFHLERLVLYSYGSLFRYFNHVVREPLESRPPHFDHAPAMLVIGHLERLLYGLHLAQEVPEDWKPAERLVRMCLLRRPEPPSPEDIDKEVETIQGAAAQLGVMVRETIQKLPLLDVIRYFRRDPYDRLAFDPPRVDLIDAYAKTLKARFFDQLRERLDAVKLHALEHRTQEFFRSPLAELDYYNDHPDFDFRKLGMPYFSNTRGLELVSNYLARVYKTYIHDVIQVANGTVLATNKLIQNRLVQNDAQVEDVQARINHFDQSLAPDQEDGKTLVSFRHNLSSDPVQQRFYKAFVADKDRMARALIERAQTHLGEVMRVLDDTVNSPTETVKAILRSNQLIRGKSQTLLALMSTRRDNLKEFLSLLEQTLAYDRGS